MPDTKLDSFVTRSITASLELKRAMLELTPAIGRAAELLVECYRQGGKAIFFGNGGSAADAQHLAAELECRYGFDRRPLPALALHANSSTMSAVANDYAYDQVFARLLSAHARPGDVAVAISTSGTSRNVVKAAHVARELDVRLIALTGENGAVLGDYADVLIAVPSKSTARVQECHILVGHILCEWIEESLFGAGAR